MTSGPRIELTARQLKEARTQGHVLLEVEYVAFKQSPTEANEKHVRFENTSEVASTGLGRPFCYRHKDQVLGVVSESTFVSCAVLEAQYIHQRAILIDKGDALDRAVAGELRFVSISIEADATTCSICGSLADLKALDCTFGHRYGARYQRLLGTGIERCDVIWPRGTKLRETSWTDDPACASASVLSIRHEVMPIRPAVAAATSRGSGGTRVAGHAKPNINQGAHRDRPTPEQRARLLELVGARFTTG